MDIFYGNTIKIYYRLQLSELETEQKMSQKVTKEVVINNIIIRRGHAYAKILHRIAV